MPRFTTKGALSAWKPAATCVLGVVLLATTAHAQSGIITTYAGGGPNNMPAISANLANPAGLTVDASGNFYVSTRSQHRVFKVDPMGLLTVVAGNGTPGFSGDDGPATEASLSEPFGVAVDTSGNLLIADRRNHRIRRVNLSTGIITTMVGNGSAGFSGDGGPATSASLFDPLGVCVDMANNLYIADEDNHRVRRVDATTGIITTVAGNGIRGFSGDGNSATNASLRTPSGVAVDSGGNFLIADTGNHRIRRVDTTTGIITTVVGNGTPAFSGDTGHALNASILFPFAIVVDAGGNLFLSEFNHRIRRVDAGTGIITTVAGNGARTFGGDGGPATSASLHFPIGVTLDVSANLLIADSNNNRVRRVDHGGTIVTIAGNGASTFGGDGGPATNASLFQPSGLALDASGNLFIAEQFNHRIRRVDAATGIITTVAGNGTRGFRGDGGPATDASLTSPVDVASDASGNLFITDQNHRIRHVDAATGIIITVAGNGTFGFSGDGGPATNANLSQASGVALDANGNLFFADWVINRIRRVDAVTGIITTVAGDGTSGFSGDGGPATNAALSIPRGVAVDASGNLFVADTGNHRIRRVDAGTGIITTVVGNGTFGFSGDGGPATSASLTPSRVALDTSGNLFIADFPNHRIRRVDAATGIITTVAGNGIPGFNGDGGAAIGASLAFPIGVAVSASSDLFVADQFNDRIRLVSLTGPPVAVAGSDQTVIVGETVQLDGSASVDPDGSIVSYHWELGDGLVADGVMVTHVYSTAGTFTVTLTVTDNEGASGTETAIITVRSTSEAIADLAGLVASFNLQQGIANSLDSKLQNAMDALNAANAGNREDAANKLQAFINAVEAQRGKELTDAQADQLVAAAQRILAVV